MNEKCHQNKLNIFIKILKNKNKNLKKIINPILKIIQKLIIKNLIYKKIEPFF